MNPLTPARTTFLKGTSFNAVFRLLLTGLTMTGVTALTGCKKDAVDTVAASSGTSSGGSVKNLARTYGSAETDRIVKNAETFQAYANALRSNGTPEPGSLPNTFSPEEAVFLLESTTNYWYGRPDYSRLNDSARTISSDLTSTGPIDLQELAVKYNDFREQFKGFYESFSDEKSFGFADFEFDAQANTLVAIIDVRYGALDALVRSWIGGHTDEVFTGNNFYKTEYGNPLPPNPCGTNIVAAPMLSSYVRQNLGFYDNLVVYQNGPTPVAVNVSSVQIDAFSPQAQTSNSNPHVNYEPNVQNNKRLLSVVASNAVPFAVCAAIDAMNFYRSEQKQMILAEQAARGKKCIKYDLATGWVQNQYNSNQSTFQHWLPVGLNAVGLQFGDIIYIPSSTVATF